MDRQQKCCINLKYKKNHTKLQIYNEQKNWKASVHTLHTKSLFKLRLLFWLEQNFYSLYCNLKLKGFGVTDLVDQ
jgi:hypothetical protein